MNDFYEYYGPEHNLHFKPKDEASHNTKDYLDFIKTKCLQHLKQLEHAPSVGIQDYVVQDYFNVDSVEARSLSRKSHPQEAEAEDGALEFQRIRQ
jgi:hypothetical protein